ncbi:MAG: DUF5701 family protein [Nocardioidaceae bacterium]
MSTTEFLRYVAPLEERLPSRSPGEDDDRFPFLLVITSQLLSPQRAMELTAMGSGRAGWIDMTPVQPLNFLRSRDSNAPAAAAYLITDVDTRGRATLNIRPQDALPLITEQKRTPLTIEEGVSLLTQHPSLLETHNAYWLMGSRAGGGDKRVPAIWVSKGNPRLGWCWNGTPHTWLGAGSAAARIGPA